MGQCNSCTFLLSYLIEKYPPDLQVALPVEQGQGYGVGQAVMQPQARP